MTLFPHLSIFLSILQFGHFVVDKRTFNVNEQRYTLVEDYFRLLNISVNKQYKSQKLRFVSLRVANVSLIKECLDFSTIYIFVEMVRLLDALEEHVSRLLHEYIPLRRNVAACVIKAHDAESLCLWRSLFQLHKKMEYSLQLDLQLASFNVSYVCCS